MPNLKHWNAIFGWFSNIVSLFIFKTHSFWQIFPKNLKNLEFHTGVKIHFLSINWIELGFEMMLFLWKMWIWKCDFSENLASEMWFLWKIRFWNRDLCEKWASNLWYLWKMKFWNRDFCENGLLRCDICEKWDFENAILKMRFLLKMWF